MSIFNQDERDQERGENEGLFAAVPNEDREEPQNHEYVEPSAPEREQAEPTGEASIKYVGAGGSYTDKDGTRYKKGEVTEVDEETAQRLASVRGGTLFVRADS